MTWLYGSRERGIDPVVQAQNPDLNSLRRVVSSANGLRALRAGLPLQRAEEISIGDVRRFRDALTRTKENLQVANGTAPTGYRGESDMWEVAEEVATLSDSLIEETRRKRRKKSVRAN